MSLKIEIDKLKKENIIVNQEINKLKGVLVRNQKLIKQLEQEFRKQIADVFNNPINRRTQDEILQDEIRAIFRNPANRRRKPRRKNKKTV